MALYAKDGVETDYVVGDSIVATISACLIVLKSLRRKYMHCKPLRTIFSCHSR